jgi:hypothetical protein
VRFLNLRAEPRRCSRVHCWPPWVHSRCRSGRSSMRGRRGTLFQCPGRADGSRSGPSGRNFHHRKASTSIPPWTRPPRLRRLHPQLRRARSGWRQPFALHPRHFPCSWGRRLDVAPRTVTRFAAILDNRELRVAVHARARNPPPRCRRHRWNNRSSHRCWTRQLDNGRGRRAPGCAKQEKPHLPRRPPSARYFRGAVAILIPEPLLNPEDKKPK